jgi:glycogen debranching enzyme
MEFASAHSRAYLRRDVIIWTDCVKLRYGLAPEDNPWLWDWMTKYTKLLASTFDAFRIDNCHSTPVHLGEKMLDVARKLNPNLYVEAELFTGSQDMDVHYVSRLGLNSLTREVMHANDPEDESSTLYKYGLGKPLGKRSL